MNIKDYIYFETDNSCALCGIRGVEILTEHHIDKKRKNHNSYDNRIILCHNCHNRFHQKKGISKKMIAERKKQLIYKTSTTYGVNAMKIAYRNKFGVVSMPFLLFHIVDLGFMNREETISYYSDNKKQVEYFVRFTLTDAGNMLYKKWLNA